MELNNLARIARSRWKAIASMVVLGLLVATVVSSLTPRKYESTAKLYLAVDTSQTSELYQAQAYLLGRLQSYTDLADQANLLDRVIDELSLSLSPQQLAEQVSANVETGSVIIAVSARDRNAVQAQQIADATSRLLGAYIEELETPRGTKNPAVQATVTNPPVVANSPVTPRTWLNLALGGLIGLILGVALAAVREVMDSSVREVSDFEAIVGAPVMATIAADRAVSRAPLLTDVDGFSARGEAFRLLRTNLQYLDLDSRPKSLVVTSAVADEGKTQVATNLAIAMAQAGERVLIVDGDLRRPKVASLLGLDRSVGLITVLVGRTPIEDVIQVHEASGVHCLASGPTPPNPTEVLQTEATRDLLAKLRTEYDAVIIDAPPVLPVADASILGTAADGVIIVSRYGKTRREELEAASQRLRTVGGKVFGVVVNMLPKGARGGNQKGYDDRSAGGGARRLEK